MSRPSQPGEPDTPPPVSLPQLCYDMAYFILPHYAFNDIQKVADLCLRAPSAAAPFFFVMAALQRQMGPDPEQAKLFRWHHGRWGDREYFALEYPVPPPLDLSDRSIEEMFSGPKVVLAPHFSVIVRAIDAGYFILGQALMGGGTTLRCILPEGRNCNLGPGPAPQLSASLNAVRQRVERRG